MSFKNKRINSEPDLMLNRGHRWLRIEHGTCLKRLVVDIAISLYYAIDVNKQKDRQRKTVDGWWVTRWIKN